MEGNDDVDNDTVGYCYNRGVVVAGVAPNVIVTAVTAVAVVAVVTVAFVARQKIRKKERWWDAGDSRHGTK